jgi:LacI family gluconate utilization system Gnt-I transcriptional repressor
MTDSGGAVRRSRGTGRVRIEDVARAAAVSAQTVSRFLRDPGRVGAEASARISAAIRGIGYVPNLVAGSLASNRSRIVAIIVPTLANPVHAQPVEGLGDAVRAEGYQVLVGTTDFREAVEEALIRAFIGRRVDGIVVTGGRLGAASRQVLAAAAVPVVQLWELPAEPFDMAVGLSNIAIGTCMARHFAERGYQRLAVIGHAQTSDTRSADRVAGFLAEADRQGLAPPLVLEPDRPMLIRDAAPLLDALRQAAVQAVFCTSGQLSVVLLLGARARGLAVPDDLAIAGVDSDLSSVVSPAITAIRVPAYDLGFQAGQLLLRRLAGEAVAERRIDTGFTFIPREST